MASMVDGVPVTNRNAQRRLAKQAMKARIVASLGLPSAVAVRMTELEGKLQQERAQRIKLAQEAAGLRSAVKRLQAMVLDHKAREAKRTFDAETAE